MSAATKTPSVAPSASNRGQKFPIRTKPSRPDAANQHGDNATKPKEPPTAVPAKAEAADPAAPTDIVPAAGAAATAAASSTTTTTGGGGGGVAATAASLSTSASKDRRPQPAAAATSAAAAASGTASRRSVSPRQTSSSPTRRQKSSTTGVDKKKKKKAKSHSKHRAEVDSSVDGGAGVQSSPEFDDTQRSVSATAATSAAAGAGGGVKGPVSATSSDGELRSSRSAAASAAVAADSSAGAKKKAATRRRSPQKAKSSLQRSGTTETLGAKSSASHQLKEPAAGAVRCKSGPADPAVKERVSDETVVTTKAVKSWPIQPTTKNNAKEETDAALAASKSTKSVQKPTALTSLSSHHMNDEAPVARKKSKSPTRKKSKSPRRKKSSSPAENPKSKSPRKKSSSPGRKASRKSSVSAKRADDAKDDTRTTTNKSNNNNNIYSGAGSSCSSSDRGRNHMIRLKFVSRMSCPWESAAGNENSSSCSSSNNNKNKNSNNNNNNNNNRSPSDTSVGATGRLLNTNQNASGTDAADDDQTAGSTSGNEATGAGREAGLDSDGTNKLTFGDPASGDGADSGTGEDGSEQQPAGATDDADYELDRTPSQLAAEQGSEQPPGKPIIRRCVAEDMLWNLKTVENLDTIILKFIAENYAERQVDLDELPTLYKEAVLRQLSPLLPLPIVVDRIADEDYWKRRCLLTFDVHRVQAMREHGHSWKRAFFERRLWRLVENFVPRLGNPLDLEAEVSIGGKFVRKLVIRQLMPPVWRTVKRPQLQTTSDDKEDEYSVGDIEGEFDDEEARSAVEGTDLSPNGPRDHLELTLLVKHLPCLDELRISYGTRNVGMNFNWDIFRFTLKDCAWLTEFIVGCPRLRKLEITRSRIDDVRLLMLSEAFVGHQSLTEIRLPYNVLSDDSARILARHIDHTGPLVRVLDLTHNNIGPEGALSLGFALTRNNTLRRLILRHNLILDEGGRAIAAALTDCNEGVVELSLAANGLTTDTARAFGEVLAANSTLRQLDLSSNIFGVEGGLAILRGLAKNPTICDLDLRATESGDENLHNVQLLLVHNRRFPPPVAHTPSGSEEEEEDDGEEERDEEEELGTTLRTRSTTDTKKAAAFELPAGRQNAAEAPAAGAK